MRYNMLKHRKLSRKIIKGFYEIYNELGPGFLESVYENAFFLLLEEYGLEVEKQHPITVYFRDIQIGEYVVDLIVEDKILIELKLVSRLLPEHEAQIINYLKATDINIGLLMNFGNKPEFRRFAFDRKRANP